MPKRQAKAKPEATSEKKSKASGTVFWLNNLKNQSFISHLLSYALILLFRELTDDSSGKGDDINLSSLLTEPGWKEKLDDEFSAPYFKSLEASMKDEFQKNEVFPPKDQIFNAFHMTPFDKVLIFLMTYNTHRD